MRIGRFNKKPAERRQNINPLTRKDTLLNGWGEVPLLVFVSERGTILDGDHIRGRTFWTVLKKAGLWHIRIHDLRHTFASLLIQNGEFLA
jgi:integrase